MHSFEGFVDVRRARLHYEVAGSGRPVLLIHAANVDARMWERTAAALFAREIPGAARITLAGSAHLPPLDAPEAINRILKEFLAGIEGAA